MSVILRFCCDGRVKVYVCVWVWQTERERERNRDGRTDRARMQPPTVMCPHSSDSPVWHSSVRLLHVLRERQREKERDRSINNAHWVLWGSSWWDMQWPKGDLFRLGRGASHYPAAFICLEVDGWSVFILVKYRSTDLSSCKWMRNSTRLTQLIKASKEVGENVSVWTFLISAWWR